MKDETSEYMKFEVFIDTGFVGAEHVDEIAISHAALRECASDDDLDRLMQPHVDDLIGAYIGSGYRLRENGDALDIGMVKEYLADPTAFHEKHDLDEDGLPKYT